MNGSESEGRSMEAWVSLNPADRSLDCELQGSFASTLSDDGFGYLWSGVRATHGITAGRFWFSVRVLEPLETTASNIGESADAYYDEDATTNTIHCCRVGVSKLCVDVGSLGAHNSWGYGSAGKKSTGNIYTPYPSTQPSGRCYGPGDEVACFVDLTGSRGTACISYAVNCELLGPAFELFQPPSARSAASALFPHVLIKNLAVVVNFTGERPSHWPHGQEWTGTWEDCLPWQASLAWSTPAWPGPSLRPFADCTVLMMVGLPGSGKSYQAAKLISAQSGKLQPQGSRTLLHCQQDPQQEQQQQYLLLSPDVIVKQMKVLGLRRGGGVGVAAARTCELLGQAEEVFERLLDLAAQHPGNYIIDCCNVRAETRRRRLAPFRDAGFRLVAGVTVEQDHVLHKRLTRRDQQLCPALEDLLDMAANFVLPEKNSEEFDQVQFLGSVANPDAAAVIVSAQRASAQRQLQQLQDAGWNYASIQGLGQQGALPCDASNAAAAAAGPPWSRNSSEALHLGSLSGRASSTGSGGGSISSQRSSCGTGFMPYTPAEQLYRPPSNTVTPAVQPGPGYAVGASAGSAFVPPSQYSQYAVPYDVARQRRGSHMSAPSPQASSSGLCLQPSETLVGSRSSSTSSSSFSSSSVYVRQPSWVGPQRPQVPQGLPTPVRQGSPAQQASTPPGRQSSDAGGPAVARATGSSISSSGSQSCTMQQQQQQQHPAVQVPGRWSKPSSGRGWGAPAAAAAVAGSPAAGESSAGPNQADSEEFPSLAASVQSSKPARGWPKGTEKQQQPQKVEQAIQSLLQQPPQGVQQMQQQQQQPAKVEQVQQEPQQQSALTFSKVPVSPFAACQPFTEEEQQPASIGQVPRRTQSSIAAAAVEAAAAVSGLSLKPAGKSTAVQQPKERQPKQQQQSDPFYDLIRPSLAPAATSSGELEVDAVELSLELQQKLEKLQLPGLSPDALLVAFKGQGPTGRPPRKIGEGSFGTVFACSMRDLLAGSSDGSSSSSSTAAAMTAAGDNKADTVAVKVLPPRQCTAAEFVRELDVLAHCRHKHLVALKGYCLSKRVLVFEYCSCGSLEDWLLGTIRITRGAKLGWRQRLCIAQQVATALLFLHSQPEPIIHRDIKPNNILLTGEHAQLQKNQDGSGTSSSTKDVSGWEHAQHAERAGEECSSNGDRTISCKAAACRGACGAGPANSTGAAADSSPERRMSARLADVGLSRFLPVNLTSVHSSSSTPGCFYYLPDEYNIWGVVSCGLDVFSFGLTLANILTGDVRTKPRILHCWLVEQLEAFEVQLAAAALERQTATAVAAAAGVSGSAPVASMVPAGSSSFTGASQQQRATQAAGSSGDGAMFPSRSHWWLGVMANCSSSSSVQQRNGSSVGLVTGAHSASGEAETALSPPGSRQVPEGTPASPPSTPAATPPAPAAGPTAAAGLALAAGPAAVAGAAVAGAAAAGAADRPGKSWASIAASHTAKPRAVAHAAAAKAAGAGRGKAVAAAPAAGTTSRAPRPHHSVGVAVPAAAAGTSAGLTAAGPATLPPPAAELPEGFKGLLDSSAGDWPPRVAVGLAMLALACSEGERRKRPTMRDVVTALTALQQQADM